MARAVAKPILTCLLGSFRTLAIRPNSGIPRDDFLHLLWPDKRPVTAG